MASPNSFWLLQIARSSYSFLNADLFWPFMILHLFRWRQALRQQSTCCLFTWCRWTEPSRGAWEANAARDPLPIILNILSVSLAIIHVQVHHARAFSRARASPSCGHWTSLLWTFLDSGSFFPDRVPTIGLNFLTLICVPWFCAFLFSSVSPFCLIEQHGWLWSLWVSTPDEVGSNISYERRKAGPSDDWNSICHSRELSV